MKLAGGRGAVDAVPATLARALGARGGAVGTRAVPGAVVHAAAGQAGEVDGGAGRIGVRPPRPCEHTAESIARRRRRWRRRGGRSGGGGGAGALVTRDPDEAGDADASLTQAVAVL